MPALKDEAGTWVFDARAKADLLADNFARKRKSARVSPGLIIRFRYKGDMEPKIYLLCQH